MSDKTTKADKALRRKLSRARKALANETTAAEKTAALARLDELERSMTREQWASMQPERRPQEDTMLELRPEVAAFAQAMEAQLRANDHKPGWRGDSPEILMRRLYEEAGELRRCVVCREPWSAEEAARVLKEAADVANFAMMVADVCGGLET